MPKAVAFWIIYLLFLVLALWFSWPLTWGITGTIIVVFVLIGLLGWAQFGKPIQ